MSDKGNWLKLHRQAIDSAVFADPHLWHMWSWLLMRASFRTQHVPMSVGRGTAIVTLRPGQLVTGRHNGASDLGLPDSTFRNRLERLESMGMITIAADTHWSIVSIVNWLIYQQSDDETRTGNTSSNGQARDSYRPNDFIDANEKSLTEEDKLRTGKGQPKDTYKNAKKDKKREGAHARTVFVPPALEEVRDYWREAKLRGNPEGFFDHFTSNGWRVGGKAPMKDWQASARNWSRNEKSTLKPSEKPIDALKAFVPPDPNEPLTLKPLRREVS